MIWEIAYNSEETTEFMLKAIHNETAHCEVIKTLNRLSKTFYGPRMDIDCLDFVTKCETCKRVKGENSKPKTPLKPIPVNSQPLMWQLTLLVR